MYQNKFEFNKHFQMNKSDFHHQKPQTSYHWQGVMQFLYNQYQHNSQKQNVWALERNSLRQNIKELQGKLMAMDNINKQLKNRNNILEYSLRQIRIKDHENRHKQADQKQNLQQNIIKIQQLPKVPQRRPKPNKANLSRILCNLGTEVQQFRHSISATINKKRLIIAINIKKAAPTKYSLSKLQSTSISYINTKSTYEIVSTLEGHHDGVRDACFVNRQDGLSIVTVSQDCMMKVWDVTRIKSKITKIACNQTIRDHSGPIFTCVQGDGYVFTGGMEGIIRAYNFKNHSNDKKQLVHKWKTNQDDKLQPLWQLLYDKASKLLISTSSEMIIKAYKIPQLMDQKISSNLKMKAACKFQYVCEGMQQQQQQQLIPTAVCLSGSSLICSYFNSSALIHFSLQTQKILLKLQYKIQGNLSANKLITHPRCIIGAYEDTKIRMFDQRRMIQCFKGHEEAVMGLAARETDGNGLWSCGQDAIVKYWDLRKLDNAVWQAKTHDKKNDQAAHCIQTNFDGLTVSGGADAIVQVYDHAYSAI